MVRKPKEKVILDAVDTRVIQRMLALHRAKAQDDTPIPLQNPKPQTSAEPVFMPRSSKVSTRKHIAERGAAARQRFVAAQLAEEGIIVEREDNDRTESRNESDNDFDGEKNVVGTMELDKETEESSDHKRKSRSENPPALHAPNPRPFWAPSNSFDRFAVSSSDATLLTRSIDPSTSTFDSNQRIAISAQQIRKGQVEGSSSESKKQMEAECKRQPFWAPCNAFDRFAVSSRDSATLTRNIERSTLERQRRGEGQTEAEARNRKVKPIRDQSREDGREEAVKAGEEEAETDADAMEHGQIDAQSKEEPESDRHAGRERITQADAGPNTCEAAAQIIPDPDHAHGYSHCCDVDLADSDSDSDPEEENFVVQLLVHRNDGLPVSISLLYPKPLTDMKP
eukprot:792150-Rhodomonas_salina.4